MGLNNRLASRNIQELTTTDYISVIDKTKDTPVNTDLIPDNTISNEIASKVGRDNLLDTSTNTQPNKRKVTNGVFEEIQNLACDGVLGDEDRLERDNRNFNVSDTPSFCESSIDSTLLFKNVLDKQTTSIPAPAIAKLEKGILAEYSAQVRGVGGSISSADETGVVLKGMTAVKNMLSPVGGTTKERLEITTMLSCPKEGYALGDSKFLLDSILSGLLKGSYCLSITKAITVLTGMKLNPNISKDSMLTAVLNLFNSSEDIGVSDKLKLLDVINEDSSPTGDDIGRSRNKSKVIIDSLADSTTKTKNPSNTLSGINNTLGNTNPNWNKDSSGNPDYSATKGNGYLTDLAAKSAVSRNTYTGALGTPSAGDKTAQHIMLANQTSSIPSILNF